MEGFVKRMEINMVCARYCVDVIRSVMWESPVPPMPEGLSLAELYGFAKLHGVEAMVFHGLCQTDPDTRDPVWPEWENRCDMLMTQSVVQLAERDRLLSVLPAAGIRLLPVKGCWLKEQYPEIHFRQMSDLDMLIDPEDARKAEQIMLSLGYSKEEDNGEYHDGYLKPPYMGVELHLSLLPEDTAHYHYYDDVWTRAVPEESFPGVFRLRPEDEYIYYLAHLHKHVLYAGTGIRSFLDSVVYRRLWPDMDRGYLDREFEKLGLLEFACHVEQLSTCWFETGEPLPEALEPMARSILRAGTYGTQEGEFQNELQKFRTKFRSPWMVKLAYLLSCLFLPLKAMRELYPVLEKLPVLLPVMWVWRLLSRCVSRPKALLALVKKTNTEGDKIWSEFNWRDYRSK